ncbi:E3 SUMO-protein ligase ZNF451 isoform X3 [Amia ocellicauda]|uniref:E3 SUMO-protein ligase ZNF451 isoform X3 n=1 Tax=Amia ocellicauda TaxID=2972642 RepID=UPI003463C283
MSAPALQGDSDDEVEFISEGPLRPVLECIDLLSDGEDEGNPSAQKTNEDRVDRQKAKVESTLDRLARHVAVERSEREQKCKAFKEKVDSQQAHGLQELEFNQGNCNNAAKRCVDEWLKMPGLKPGALNWKSKFAQRALPLSSPCVKQINCPIMNCNRMFDNGPLLMGHLKRFDHSPCDPTVTLKGSPHISFACIACCRRYPSEKQYKEHLLAKTSSPDAEGHVSTLSAQSVQCFACPSCYLLFNIRDECLQHMSAKNHFAHSIRLSDKNDVPAPLPIPLYAKNLLIALCKNVAFSIKCTACKKVLSSHMEVTAHFKAHCRNAGPLAEAEKTVAQVVEVLKLKGYCSVCCKIFRNDCKIVQHEQLTLHRVEIISTMEKAILHFCNFFENNKNPHKTEAWFREPRSTLLKRPPAEESENNRPDASRAKRQRVATSSSAGSVSEDPGREEATGSQLKSTTTAWFCECGQRFSVESAAERHITAVNQIFCRCCVCGKQTSEGSVMGLHMSRFHGGAHLNNYAFWCQKCKIQMPRKQDIMSHVSDCHSGHTYYNERKWWEEKSTPQSSSIVETAGVEEKEEPRGRWMCRMCEDLFSSETLAYAHCKEIKIHSFQKYICGDCKQKFLKVDTLRHHIKDVHKGQLDVKYFCGLCDSMEYDTEEEFQVHYQSYHSKDYVVMKASPEERPARDVRTCPCRSSSKSKRKAVFDQCVAALFEKGKVKYSCRRCHVTQDTAEEMQAHIDETHKPCGSKKKTNYSKVRCLCCMKLFTGPFDFHLHYHSKHCHLEPCVSGPHRAEAPLSTPEKANGSGVPAEANELEDLKRAVALSLQEANEVMESNREIEEILQRSLEEF